jgi:hypothetical protein
MRISDSVKNQQQEHHKTVTSDDEYIDYSNRYTSSMKSNTVDDQNLHKHENFYCAVQACCYIVCFHGVSLGLIIRNHTIDQMNWEMVMSSKYQPIKFCLQSVRVEFLRLARHLEMFPSVCMK